MRRGVPRRITGGVAAYHDGVRTPFSAIADNDRIFFEIKQSFQFRARNIR